VELTLGMASSHYQTYPGRNFISCGLCRTVTDSELLLLDELKSSIATIAKKKTGRLSIS